MLDTHAPECPTAAGPRAPRPKSAAAPDKLVLEQLRKNYQGSNAVDDVSMRIPTGQFVSMIGPSGSGKTTTLMMIAGFVPPDSGRILLDGKDITALTPQSRGLGMVFQNYALFPHLTVSQNVAFPLEIRRTPRAEIRERVAQALEMVRLSPYAERKPQALSGGQQQRVALARAIVFRPPVVLMDEPLGALDKNLRYQMQVEIKELQQRLNTTVVYVTHDQEEAMNMSDLMVIMNGGRIEQVGAPREIYEQPRTVFAGKFLGEANVLLGSIESGAQASVFITGAGRRLVLAPGLPRPSGKTAALFLRPEKVMLEPIGGAAGGVAGRLPGIVRRVSFLGHIVRYGVDVGERDILIADVPNTRGRPVHVVGDAVEAEWPLEDTHLLEAT